MPPPLLFNPLLANSDGDGDDDKNNNHLED
jgi:hypothetical protein